MRYIAFLRGINVGGKHKVKMDDLRNAFEQAGFSEVKTHIQSGNVLFESEQRDEAQLEASIAHMLGERFGFAIPIRLRTMQEVIVMTMACPFHVAEDDKRFHVYVSLMPEEPQGEIRERLLASGDPSTLYLHGRELYALWERTPGEAPTSMATVEKVYKNMVTTRNMNVIRKLARM